MAGADPGEWGPDGLGTSAARKARLRELPLPGPHTALWYWPQLAGGLLRVAWNGAWIQLARYAPWLSLKIAIYRMLGARLGDHTAVGLMVMLDIFYPQDITVGDETVIGYGSVLLCHEVTRASWKRGPIQIGRDVTIGAGSTILPGVVIGDGATISAMSLVNKDVPPGAFVGGVPIRRIE